MANLTRSDIDSLTPREKDFCLYDGGSLRIRVRPSGAKTWEFAYKWQGRGDKVRLGSWPELSVPDARAERDRMREILRSGRNPRIERELQAAALDLARQERIARERAEAQRQAEGQRDARTLELIAREWFAQYCERKQLQPVSAKDIVRSLELHLFPALGRRSMHSISQHELHDVINKVLRKKPATAGDVFQRCGMVWRFAQRYGVADVTRVFVDDFYADLERALTARPPRPFANIEPSKAQGLLQALRAAPASAARNLALAAAVHRRAPNRGAPGALE